MHAVYPSRAPIAFPTSSGPLIAYHLLNKSIIDLSSRETPPRGVPGSVSMGPGPPRSLAPHDVIPSSLAGECH